MNEATARKLDIFTTARNSIAMELMSRPEASSQGGKVITLYGPNGRPVTPDSYYSYRRQSAQQKGSLKNWNPQRVYSRDQEARDRETTVARSIDLTNNDPHAAGVVDTFASTIAGPGLMPIPALDVDALPYDKDKIRSIQSIQRNIYRRWYPFADAGRRLTFGGIQYLCIRNLIEYGEYIILLYMIPNLSRPYNLACHVINPLRLKTPIDKLSDPRIKDGVELGEYSEPVAYWIKLSSQTSNSTTLPDTSANFRRIPAAIGHRLGVVHRFTPREPEDVRGYPLLSPSMKFFRDLNDFLDTELVSNIFASAISLFIETTDGADPLNIARNLSNLTETNSSGANLAPQEKRYQEMEGGTIMYGSTNQKPHLLSPDRPGTTFDPFTKIIKKAIAMGVNIPYPVIFKDVEGVNFAGFRSAMMDAWRVFMMHRTWLAEDTCQPVYTMLQEEAYLRNEIDVDDFYINMLALTRADWRGSPKGDIEPIKAAQADALLIQNNLKTRAEAIAERGGELRATLEQLEEEQAMMKERGLTEEKITPEQSKQWVENENKTGDDILDDKKGAGNEGM
jgi:lambda family phage portal protein